MSGPFRGLVPGASVAQGRKIDSLEEPLTRAKQDWRDSDMHFVDEALPKALLDDIGSAPESYVLSFGSFAGSLERYGNAVRHEVKCCSAFHDKWCAGMVR